MLNIEEASKLLGVSKRTLRNWEKIGKIKSYRTPGGHRRYDEQYLLKIIGKI
jgi:excisionase family DNA binding protein